MKIKIFVAREIQYFELGIFSFNSYVCYLTRSFIALTRAFNLATRAFNLATRAFSLATRTFSLLTRGFEFVTREFDLVTREFEHVTREFELITREFELITRGFELVTPVLLFHCDTVSSLMKLHACNFIKKETLTQVFSCDFAKFLRTTSLQNTYGRLLHSDDASYFQF